MSCTLLSRFLLQVIHPEHLCFVLPASVSLEEGALCEPLSVAIHACHRAAGLHTNQFMPTRASEGFSGTAIAGQQAVGDLSLVDNSPSTRAPTIPSVLVDSSASCLRGLAVAVLGAGPIGLLCAVTAVAFGAVSVVLCDVSSDRVAFAREHLLKSHKGRETIKVLLLHSSSSVSHRLLHVHFSV